MWRIIGAVLATGLATPAASEVVRSEEAGFEVASTVTVQAPASQLWSVLITPARWWDGSHTYSGSATNLSLKPAAGGCFCEALPDGGVEHARIVHIKPGELLRLSGALGPLQSEAVQGTLTFAITRVGPRRSTIKMTYVIGGYMRGGGAKLAEPVDAVLAAQLRRLAAAIGGN